MIINSLLLKTSLIFARNESEIVERESYMAIKTPANPGFHWGNYLIFKKAPQGQDIDTWKMLFKKEFPYYDQIKHYVFAWDEPSPPADEEYLAHKMELEKSIALVATELIKPKHYNDSIIVRPLTTPEEWDLSDLLQTQSRPDIYNYNEFLEFKKNQSKSYQNLEKENRGHRFGAFLDGKLVADLGIFHEDRIARYQNVVTHPDFRRQGICATLVYESGKYIMNETKIDKMVMVADPDYHAAKIYESVGFQPKEESYNLYWYINK
jgi:ribosomal protein S18 acetylase RimI-like enzyme